MAPFDEHRNPSPRRPEALLSDNKDIPGQQSDLEAFARLLSTPIRHPSRSEALHRWKAENRVVSRNARGKAVKATPKFRGVDLRGADLRDVYAGYVDLRGARLDQADLRGARMKGAWLDGASLCGAKLDDAYFAFSSFAGARLVSATARGTNFREAKLIRADFSRADLTGALLADTQRRDWNLRDVRCEYVYWDSESATSYAPGEFESLFSEEAMVTLESSGPVGGRMLSTLPMLINELKAHDGAALRLHSFQDSNGKFQVRLKIDDTGGLTVGALESVLKKYVQAQNVFHGPVGVFIQKQEKDVGTYNNTFNAPVGPVSQGDGQTVHIGSVVVGDIQIDPNTAKTLLEIVGGKQPEKPGFTEELKKEALEALKSVAMEQVKALPRKIYETVKEFFPSYVRPFLP